MILKVLIKNPTNLEALQYLGTGESFEECDAFADGELYCDDSNDNLPTLSTDYGSEVLKHSDWLIKNCDCGIVWRVTNKEFLSTYEGIA